MNLRSLSYLVALEKHGSFKSAADDCHFSQPALSIQIKKFEDELGVLLLERNPKRVYLYPLRRRSTQARSWYSTTGR